MSHALTEVLTALDVSAPQGTAGLQAFGLVLPGQSQQECRLTDEGVAHRP